MLPENSLRKMPVAMLKRAMECTVKLTAASICLIGLSTQVMAQQAPPGWHSSNFPELQLNQPAVINASEVPKNIKAKAAQQFLAASATNSTAINAFTSDPYLIALAGGLKNDPGLIYNFVRNEIEIDYTHGAKKGPLGTYLDRSGNVYDQAELLLTLLEISGYDAAFQRVNVVHSAEELASWLKVYTPSDAITDFSRISRVITGMGVTSLTGTFNAIEFEHLVVSVTVGGSLYYLDPSYKPNTYQSGLVNVSSGMGFNRNSFVSAAKSGRRVNRVSVKNTLDTYANNWVNTIRQHHANATVEDVLSHWRPDNRAEDDLQDASSYITSYGSSWQTLPSSLTTSLRIRHQGIDQTFDSRDIYTKRLAIYYATGGNSPVPNLYLDGQLVATGNATSRGSSNVILFDVDHPYASGFDGNDQSWQQQLRAGGAYTIMNAWGSVGPGHTEFQEKNLSELQSLSNQSEALLNQSLMVMGLKWTSNRNMADDFSGRITDTVRYSLHTVGIAGTGDVTGQDGGPYVDVGGGIGSSNLQFGTANQTGKFVATGLLASAFEHGIIEQSQPYTAVSTVKLFDIAAQNNDQLFEANSTNWASVRSSLTGYSTGTLNSLDAVISQGGRLLLPENGSLRENQWQGTGYFTLIQNSGGMSAGYIIGGGFKGGFSTDTGEVETTVTTEVVSNEDVFSENPSTNRERIVSGDGVFSQQDLSTGAGAGQLTLTRSYNGRDSRTEGYSGGWRHNYDSSLAQASDILRALHQGTALDATASIVGMYVVDQLMQSVNDSLFDSVGLSAAVYQWLMDEYTNNAQVLSIGTQVHKFMLLPNGQYSAPKGVRSTLIQQATGYQLNTKSGTQVSFNTQGKATRLTDRNGNDLTFSYIGDTLNRVTNSFGRHLQFNYSGDQLTGVSDDSNRSISYTYTNNQLTGFTNPNNETATYAYDTEGRLNQVFSPAYPNSPEYTDSYDIWGRKVTRTKATGAILRYYYGPGYRNETLDAEGNRHVRYFDDRDDMVREVNALNQVMTYQYDSIHRRTQTVYAANGMQTLLAYDDENNITHRTGKAKTGSGFADRSESYTYTTFGNVLTHTDISGDTTNYTYDTQGNLLTTQLPSVNGVRLTTTNTYHSNGLVASNTGPDGVQVNYSYDAKGNLTTQTVDPTGENIVHTYTYWPAGDARTYRDPLGNTTTYNTYDDARRLTKQTSPTGEVSEFQYNTNGLLILQREQATNLAEHPSGWASTSFTYTRDNQVASQIDPQGNTNTFVYDLMNNQILATDAEGRQSKTIYDALYRPLHAQRMVNNSFVDEQVNSYTVTGQINSRTDGNGNSTIYAYDGHDQLSSVTYPDGTAEGYTYFADGQLQQFTAQTGDITSYQYDALKRITQRQSGSDERLVYEYNNQGQQQRIRQYLPAASSSAIDISYVYDGISRLQSVTDGNSRTLQYSYDKLNRRTHLTFPDSQSVSYSYDGESRLTSLGYANQNLATYTYNKLSQLTDINFTNGTNTQLAFEADSDLASLMHNFSGNTTLGYSFSYNNAGQQISKQHQGEAQQWLPLATYQEAYSINTMNQTTRIGTDTFAFDVNGNLQANVGLDYAHNALNQLTEISASGVNGNIRYRYDALGRRIQKDVYGKQTQYLYDGDEVIAEYDASGNLTKRFIYGSGVDSPVAFITNGQTYIYHTDEIGSVVALSDSNGAIAEQYSYGPFGQSHQLSLIGNPLRYTARRLDDETGHYYYRARYYEPQWGKFLQADPIGYADGMNRYAYVGHDPIGLIDPFGTMAVGGGFSTSTGTVDTSSRESGGILGGVGQLLQTAQGPSFGSVLEELATPLPGFENFAQGIAPPEPRTIARMLFGPNGAQFSKIAPATSKQLQKKFKHAIDFGVKGNFNKANAGKFNQAIQRHINASGTREIPGVYRGNNVIFQVNPNTGLTVIQNPNGSFLSGWKLNPQQLIHVLRDGKL
jgi:RHS repeat-associated protein